MQKVAELEKVLLKLQQKRKVFKDYLNAYDLQNVITEMTYSVIYSQSPNPIVYMIKYLTGLLTEEERIHFKINIDPPYPTGVPNVNFPDYQTKNVLSKYLYKSNWSKYKYVKTTFGNNINNMTCLTDNNKNDKIGAAIVDKDCLNAYKDLLDKVITDVHCIENSKQSANPIFDIDNSYLFYNDSLFFYDKLKDNLKKIKFVFYRNIEGYTYNNIDKRNGILKEDLEKEILLMKNEGFLPKDLEKIESNKLQKFINSYKVISKEYEWMTSAGLVNKGYTLNERSILANKDLSIIILINFANHLEIMLTIESGRKEFKMQEKFNYLMKFMKRARLRFPFEVHPKYGYVTSNISLLGAGYKVYVLFKHKNVKVRKDIFDNKDFYCCDIDLNQNHVLFESHFHLNDSDIISFNKRIFARLYGYKVLCDNLDKNVDSIKAKLTKRISPVYKTYEALFPNMINIFDLFGDNINKAINFYKLSEKGDELLFISPYSYLVFKDFISKFIYYRDNITLDTQSYLERQEKPRVLVNIETRDFIEQLINFNVYISRNIADYPFPISSGYDDYNSKVFETIKSLIESMNSVEKIGTIMTFSEAKEIINENNIKIFHTPKMEKYGIAPDYPKDTGIIKFEKPYLFATLNDLNHINFILSINKPDESVEIKTYVAFLIQLVHIFSCYIKFAFSKKYGFLTACPQYMGNGIQISADIKLKNLKNDYIMNYIRDKNMTFEEVSDKRHKEYRIIRLLNKGSFCYSETELLSEFIGVIHDLIIEDS